jgi:hypothetical protein
MCNTNIGERGECFVKDANLYLKNNLPLFLFHFVLYLFLKPDRIFTKAVYW